MDYPLLKRAVGILLVLVLCAQLAPAGEVVYVVTKDGRVTSLDANGLGPISSSLDFGHPNSVTTLTTGNAVLVDAAAAEVSVVSPTMERVSNRKYPELKTPLVGAGALSDGMFIVADKTQLAVTDQAQSKVFALRDLSKWPLNPNLVVDRTIHHVDTRGSQWGQHIAALVDTKPSPDAEGKAGVWFGKVDWKDGKFLPTDYREDMPGATVSIPFVSGMWLVVGGGEMSLRGWGKGFPKKAVESKMDEIIAGAAIPNRRFALVNAKGEISVWRYTDDSFTCVVGPSKEYGKIVAIQTTDKGDVVVGSADGKITLLHLALPPTQPSTSSPILAATQASAVLPPVARPTLQVMAQKADLGSLIGLAIGRTP